MSGASDSRPPGRGSLTTWSLAALAAGLVLGVIGRASGTPAFELLARAVRPIGDLWISALQMTVLPLVVVHLLAAIVSSRGSESVGALGVRAILLFVGMLVAAGLLTFLLAPPLIGLVRVAPDTIASLQAATQVPEEAAHRPAAAGSLAQWIASLLPRNLLEAALRGDILPLLLFTALFGIAVTRIPDEYRIPLTRTFQGLAQAMLTVVRWMLRGTPAGVFVLMYVFALRTGGASAGLLGTFVLIVCGLLLLFTALLYPLSASLGRTSLQSFARAAAPAQLVAVSTQSSIASLPALVEGGGAHLRLPSTSTSFVLPLSVSIFKLNRTVSAPAKLLFLAHMYGVPLSLPTIATFLATIVLLSFSTLGVSSSATAFGSLPAYLAAGVPIEGVVILEAVETIPDIFKTLFNVTADMSVATLLSRSSRRPPVAMTAAESPPAVEGAS